MKSMNTLDMLSVLEKGQIAKAIGWGVLVKNDCGDIIVIKNLNSDEFVNKPLPMTNLILNDFEWKLQPKPITLEKAVSEIENGGIATLAFEGKFYKYTDLESFVKLNEILKGTWYEGHILKEDLAE